MELDSITVQNFRQYYKKSGGQTIDFSQSSEQNVTVIHGANGAGKSALRNAFLWLFYDKVELPQPDHIANERAMAEAKVGDTVHVEVELEFDHENRHYWGKRWAKYEKQQPDDREGELVDQDAEVRYIDVDGKTKKPENPNNSLERFIPERLSHLFFFHGEEIDQLARQDNQEKIKEAIRDLMGLEILERSIRHLEHVEKNVFEEEIKEFGSQELGDLIDKKNDKEEEKEEKETELQGIKSNLKETRSELDAVSERLRELEETRELQEERDELEEEEEALEKDNEHLNDEIRELCSEYGYLVFAMPAVQKTGEALQQKRKKGEIPSDIKEPFVNDLLDIGECICGRPLEEGSDPHLEVQQWRNRAGSGELDQAAINITGRLRELSRQKEEMFDEIQERLNQRSDNIERLNSIEERLDEISGKISEKEQEDIKDLEERRNKLQEEIGEFKQKRRDVQDAIESLDERIDEIEEEIEEAREQEEKSDQARRRYVVTKRVRELLDQKFESYQDEVRQRVDEKVKEIFADIMSKDYWTEIQEDYSLEVYKNMGGDSEVVVPVAASTGERQVASLSFIGGLTYLTRDQYESSEDNVYFQGGIYPLLMDAPFGYLGTEYQRGVSQKMPSLADQVVVLVTEPQWEAEVKDELSQYAGEQYYLQYYDPDEDEGVEYEYTEIMREEV